MTRNAREAQNYLEWYDDIPYLVTWTPGERFGTLTAHVADEDFAPLAAAPWTTSLPMDAAAAALDQLAAVNVQMNHDADKAARGFDRLDMAA